MGIHAGMSDRIAAKTNKDVSETNVGIEPANRFSKSKVEDDSTLPNEMPQNVVTTDYWRSWPAVLAVVTELVLHVAILVIILLVMIDLYKFCWKENEVKLILNDYYYYGSNAYYWTLLGSYFSIHLLVMNVCVWVCLLYGVAKSDLATLKTWSILRKACAVLMLLPSLANALGGDNQFCTINTFLSILYLAYSLVIVDLVVKVD